MDTARKDTKKETNNIEKIKDELIKHNEILDDLRKLDSRQAEKLPFKKGKSLYK